MIPVVIIQMSIFVSLRFCGTAKIVVYNYANPCYIGIYNSTNMEIAMNVDMFSLPTMNDGVSVVEQTFCQIYTKYRNGETLQPEVLDWMDSANTWLMESK